MADQKPSIGRIVHYKQHLPRQRSKSRRRLPNGQVLLDGNDTEWVTSRCGGEGEGQWSWPERA